MKYKAFISYSHADSRFARRLHGRLESFRPRGGLTDADGRPPGRLRPVFLDREELAASTSLSEQIQSALDDSERLIVLCSPAAAASRYVEEEVRWFRERRGADGILAIIVDGEPPGCFPPALIAGGAEPIAADARAVGDGFDDAALKLIAALLNTPYAALKARDLVRRRRRTRILAGVAAVFALISVVAVYAAWRAIEETRRANEELTRAEAAILVAVDGVGSIVRRVSVGAREGSVPTALADQLLGAAEQMIDGVVDLAPSNRRLQREQGELLLQFARHYVWVGDTGAALAAADRAAGLLGALVADAPEDADLLRLNAEVLVSRGDSALAQSRRADAAEDYGAALDLAARAVAADPESSEAARALFDVEGRVGGARRATGDLDGALAAHERSLDIARAWTDRLPEDLEWARAATISLHNIGDIRVDMGDTNSALAMFEVALSLARDLAKRRTGDAELERGLAFALLRVGDTRRAGGNAEAALDGYEEALTIHRDVLARDPDNVLWRRDLSVALGRVGVARLALGDIKGAIDSYQEALDIRRKLLAKDPDNARFGRRLVLALGDLGDAWATSGDPDAARAAYEEARSRAVALADGDRKNILLVRDVASLDLRTGDVEARAGDQAAALAAYRRADAVLDRAAGAPAAVRDLARDRFLALWRIALIEPGPSGEAWAKVVAVLETLEATGALSPQDARYLDAARRKLAEREGG